MRYEKSFWDFLRWRFSTNSTAHLGDYDPPTPTVANDGAYLRDPQAPDSITWVGHATFILHLQGLAIITDPMFSYRAFLIPRRVPPALGPEAVPKEAVVLISHNHYDHLDADSVAALGDRALFICPLGLGDLLKEMGAQRVKEVDWWQRVEVQGAVITALPVQHWSRRLGQSANQSLWCGYMIERGGRRIFYGADSGYFIGFKEIGRRFPGMDAALLGVGAYEPRWFMHYTHMDIAETLRAFVDLGARRLIPTQWGVFDLGDEPVAWPAEDLRRQAQKQPELAGRVEIMPVGGRLILE
jgi:L-ascorbate metabolism protein UlaG (beta-lactamase superfamily)